MKPGNPVWAPQSHRKLPGYLCLQTASASETLLASSRRLWSLTQPRVWHFGVMACALRPWLWKVLESVVVGENIGGPVSWYPACARAYRGARFQLPSICSIPIHWETAVYWGSASPGHLDSSRYLRNQKENHKNTDVIQNHSNHWNSTAMLAHFASRLKGKNM